MPEDDEDEVPQGGLLYRQHRSRERNRPPVARKKAQVVQMALLPAKSVAPISRCLTVFSDGPSLSAII
jgi:hypothetical protein